MTQETRNRTMRGESSLMQRIPVIALAFLALTISPLQAEESSKAAWPLGAFDFDFARLGADATSQVSAAQSIGFSGMVMRVNTKNDLEKLNRYQAAIGDGPFKVHAGLWTVFFNKDLDVQNAHIDTVIPALKKLNAALWVVLRVQGGQKVEREQIVDFLRSLAERTKAAGVELIIYPHWSGGNPMNISLIESAEEAIPYVKEVQNVYISLHLCHQIMAGNGHRLDEVAAKIKPWLGLPSINGADIDAVHETSGWDRGIQPLTMGDYDSSQLLEALKSVDYKGPVILHTWGLQDAAADHHQTSFKRFQEMVDALYNKAASPNPGNGDDDVSFDIKQITWQAGVFAVAQDVFFGTDFNDVNVATIASDSAGVYQGRQDETLLTLNPLAFGQTYYWRVDEVNGTSDKTIFKGEVWSFTVEPYSYPIEIITATASGSFTVNMGPEKTIDGSGLNESNQHSNDKEDMWLSDVAAEPTWIQYEFDRFYKLDKMMVWNSNQMNEPSIGLGAKEVTIVTSLDGEEWVQLNNVTELAQASGLPDYTANTTVDLAGALAKFVKIAIHSGYGETPQYGLSEVRFFYTPMTARQPKPASGSVTDSADVVLNWRAGREAALHEVYLGTDPDDLVFLDSTIQARYDLSSADLEYGSTYYWQINEVNEALNPASYTGEIWSFAIPDHGIIDDFDQYDDDCNRIFFTWIDGIGHHVEDCNIDPFEGNGSSSIVGNDEAPYAEKSIVISGQALSIAYDNSLAPYYSEVTSADFALPSDWIKGGAEALSLQFRGHLSAFTEHPDGSVVLSSASLGIGNNADEFRYVYKKLSGDGSIIARVDSMVDTDPGAKCGVMIRENLDPESMYAMVAVTSRNGVAFQDRNTTSGATWATHIFSALDLTRIKTVTIGLGDRNDPHPGGVGYLYIDNFYLTML